MDSTIIEYINVSWLYQVFMIIYGVTILSVIAVVVSENRNPVKSLAWVTVLLVVPAVGLVLFFFFGRSIKGKRFISKRNRRRLKRHEPAKAFNAANTRLDVESVRLIKLGQSLMSAPYYEGNHATVYDNGREKFDAMVADIMGAKRFIYLQYYIFEDDNLGKMISQLLIDKARQGVVVRVIYDHVGSFHAKGSFFKRMHKAGIEAYPFFKISLSGLASRINWRNHRKICIIDGTIGYIGGMNIADRYIDGGSRFASWRDVHLRVTGPIMRSLNHSFLYDWNLMGRPLPEEFPEAPAFSNVKGGVGMQLITSGPTSQWSNIGLIFLKAIGSAKHSIFIQTPYFLPTEGLLRALEAAALSKIDVRLMIPRHSDSRMLSYASFSYIKECLRSGIKIYLYDAGMLHSKMIIVDDEFSTIGSTNFDFRSFEHNFESNLFIYDKGVNEELRQVFKRDMGQSTRILPFDWERRPRLQKAFESVMRLLAPIL